MAGGGRALVPSPDGTPPRHDRHEERTTKKEELGLFSSLRSYLPFLNQSVCRKLTKIRSRGVSGSRTPAFTRTALGSSIGASNDSGALASAPGTTPSIICWLQAGRLLLPPPPESQHTHTQAGRGTEAQLAATKEKEKEKRKKKT